MIKVTDINNLPSTQESLNDLQAFLSNTQSHQTYQMAFYKYVLICSDLNLYSLIIEITQKRLNDIKHLEPTIYEEKIISILIDASLKLEAYDITRYYIDYRKRYLPVMESYLSLFDEIKYAKALNLPIIDFLLRLENESLITQDERIYVYEEILNYYLSNDNYDLSLKYINKFKELNIESKYLDTEYQLLLAKKEYLHVKEMVLESIKNKTAKTIHIVNLIEALYYLDELKLASDYEAAYENDFEGLTLEKKNNLYEIIVKIYEKLNHKASIDLYKKKLNRVKRELVKITPKETNTTSEPLNQKEVIFLNKINETSKAESHNADSEVLSNLLTYVFSLQSKTLLREKLRLLFIKLQTKIDFTDIVLYDNTLNPNFYHFKKERLYDKYLIDNLVLGTLVEEINFGKTEFLHLTKLDSYINIITQKPYDELVKTAFVYSVGLEKSLIFHFSNTIIDPGAYYDLLNGVSSIIEILLITEKQNARLVNQAYRFDELFSSSNIAMRIINELQSHYNQVATDLLKIETRAPLELFLINIKNSNLHDYKHLISYLLQSPGRHATIDYEYNNLYLKEVLYSRTLNNQIEVVSFFINLTPINNELKTLDHYAYIDLNTSVKNFNCFMKDLPTYLDEKVSFILIELNTDLKSIYGSDLINKHFYEFVSLASSNIEDGEIYIYEVNQIMVVLPFNDIRRITKEIKSFHNLIENYQPQTIKDLSFEINSGILRYPVVTEEKNIAKLRKYFDISLTKAKNNRDYNYEFFIYSDYETEVYEDQLIFQINEAINNYMFSLSFNQVTDIRNNKVWQYEAKLLLANLSLDSKYLYKVMKARKKLKELEFHFIDLVARYLRNLSDQTGSLVKLTIPISKETFLDRKFNSNLLSILSKYKIPNSFIRIKTDALITSNKYALKIEELISSGISLDANDIQMNLRYGFHALHIEYDHNITNIYAYIKHLLTLANDLNISLIVRNVNDTSVKETLKDLGVTYIEGSIYKDITQEILTKKINEAKR